MTLSTFQSLFHRANRPSGSTSVLAGFVVLCVALLALIGFAAPASAQDETSTALLGGQGCEGDVVEVVVETASGVSVLTENVVPADDASWELQLVLPALDEAVIAWATCFAGDNASVNYSPISLRVQPGVDVGGLIELTGVPVDEASTVAEDPEATDGQPDELPVTGPWTVPLSALALVFIAGGAGMAFVSRELVVVAKPARRWPTSSWDR